MAPARAVGAKNYSAITQPKTTWGAPELKTKAGAIDLEESDTEHPKDTVAATALDDSQVENMQVDQENKSKSAEAGSKIQHTPPKNKERLSKKAKTNNNQSPWAEWFTVLPNEGKGDCAYISIAQSLANSNGTISKAKRGDFEPKGRLQAQLRVIASQELKKRRAHYIKTSNSTLPEDTALAGTWAEATSLYALANASHLDLRIWAWDNLLKQWRFYQIAPDNPNKKTTPQVVYLKLQSLHYEYLKPRENIPAEVESQWLDTAVLRPNNLQGGGKRPKIDPEACSVLGLPVPSNASSTNRRNLSILGLSQPASSSRSNAGTSSPRTATPLSILGLKRTATSAGSSCNDNTAKQIRHFRKGSKNNTLENVSEICAEDTPVPEIGAHLRCPCGWTPPVGKSCFQNSRAISHWQKCQGCRPPSMPVAQRLAILAEAGITASQRAKQRGEEKFSEWCQTIAAKHPELKPAICQPDFDVPFFGGKKSGRKFPCKHCGETRSFAQMRRLPCKKRPDDISIRTWQTTIFGKFLDPGRPSKLVKSKQTPEWKKQQAHKAAARRRAKGCLEGQGRRTDLARKKAAE